MSDPLQDPQTDADRVRDPCAPCLFVLSVLTAIPRFD
jgi:hypothetical protein